MNILILLQTMLPVLGTVTHHPEIAQLATNLTSIAEEEISRRMSQTGKTRAEILADAGAAWDEAIKGADDLKNL
ncbi:MAG TPA: hypothetical protein VIX17_11540 [Pyrinomonadaceae bacterium]|jgi:hypothetical protein